ncbi:MAG: serine hydrolase [Paracoccaceae bacterium]
MRKIIRIAVVTVLVTAVALSAAAFIYRDRIARLMTVNSLFDEANIVRNFSHMDAAFLTRDVPGGGGAPGSLPHAPEQDLPPGADQWIAERAVTGIVVLKDGRIAYENYYLGTAPTDRRISWSMAKSFLSALFGIVLAEGRIGSLDDQVTKYAPELVSSAYDGATIRNVLNMASGVRFDEDYLDFGSDINRMGRVLALGRSMDGFAAGLTERDRAPGEKWQYVSIDTHVIGMVIRGATGRDIPDLMSEKLIRPLGLEATPYFVTDGDGVAFVLGGLNLRTRDYARLGQMFAQHGQWNGQQIVPADWVAASTTPSAPTQPGQLQYGYQWWMPADARTGEYFAQGIYGQYIYIDEARDVVIAINAADRGFREPGVSADNIAMLRKIAEGM